MQIHPLYALSRRVNDYIAEHGSISVETHYTLWREWLQQLIDSPIDPRPVECSSGDEFYPRASYDKEHDARMEHFREHVVARIGSWFAQMHEVLRRYEHTSMNVWGIGYERDGSAYDHEYETALNYLLVGSALDAEYIWTQPYNAQLHWAITQYNPLCLNQLAFATYSSGSEHTEWSDLGGIFALSCIADRSKKSSCLPEMQDGNERVDAAYEQWIKTRMSMLNGHAWEDLPSIFRSSITWRAILSDVIIKKMTFLHLPSACLDVLQTLHSAALLYKNDMQFSVEQSIEMALHRLDNIASNTSMQALELDHDGSL